MSRASRIECECKDESKLTGAEISASALHVASSIRRTSSSSSSFLELTTPTGVTSGALASATFVKAPRRFRTSIIVRYRSLITPNAATALTFQQQTASAASAAPTATTASAATARIPRSFYAIAATKNVSRELTAAAVADGAAAFAAAFAAAVRENGSQPTAADVGGRTILSEEKEEVEEEEEVKEE